MNNQKRSHRLKKILLIAGGILVLIIGVVLGFKIGSQEDFPLEISASNPTTEEASVPSADDHIIVKFKEGVSETEESKIEEATKTTETKTIDKVEAKILDVPDDTDSHKAIVEFRSQYADKIDYAELDTQMEPLLVPNDTEFPKQWALPKIGAPAGWDISQGSDGTTIAVLDTGVKIDHPDLKNKLASGWNVVDNNTDLTDLNGHGTKMMGIAGAQTNNTLGIAGVGIQPKIMMIRICNNADGWAYSSDMAEAIIYAADHGVKVVSISFGGSSPSTTIRNAVNYAYDRGVFITAAAGNSGSNTMHYPAAFEHVVAVGATDSNDLKASWSSWGSWVDVTAPGVSIYSTNNSGSYSYSSGTSPATPHVAGLAALMLGRNPDLTPLQLENYLEQYSDDLGSSGKDDIYGYGRISLSKTLSAVANLPLPINPVGSLSGKVTNAKDQTPIVGARINVMQIGATKASTVSLADGTYLVKNLSEGFYELTTSANGFSSIFRKNIYVQADKETTNINFALTANIQNGNISGIVFNSRRQPVKYATVFLQLVSTPRTDITSLKRSVQTNINGRFTFLNLPEGNYYLTSIYYAHFAQKEVRVFPGSTTQVGLWLSRAEYWRWARTWIARFFR